MKNDPDLDNIDIEKLVADEKAFNEFIHTPLLEAIDELKNRWKDKGLEKKISKYLGTDIPKPFIDGFKVVLFRQLFTPNHELRRFMCVTDTFPLLKPIFLEYHEDKFTSNNPLKYSLGRMSFQGGIGKKSRLKTECRNIIDFVESDGQKIKDVKTIWGQPLIDFHHELLELVFPNSGQHIFDISEWLHKFPGGAKEYYRNVLTFFIRNGILFENFTMDGEELEFVKEVFLPAFIEVWKKIGKKPIIVALLPHDTQEDLFWVSHLVRTLDSVDKKLS